LSKHNAATASVTDEDSSSNPTAACHSSPSVGITIGASKNVVSVSFSARLAEVIKYPPLITRSPASQRERTKTLVSPGSLVEEFVIR
jgi:hypothetical protein